MRSVHFDDFKPISAVDIDQFIIQASGFAAQELGSNLTGDAISASRCALSACSSFAPTSKSASN
ncbi:MAG: hypothetical protein IIC58_02210 [Proteobacteria bacterium]|nr:hypothetical protein [Pseudomonadota bacterium]